MFKTKRRKLKTLVGLALLATALVPAGTLSVALHYLYFSRHKGYFKTPKDFNLPYQEVKIRSQQDGVNIAGWFLPPKKPDATPSPAIIAVHGHHSNMGDGREMSILGDVALPLLENNMAVLLIDLRNHGSSEDLKPVTMGYLESNDVLGALSYLEEHAEELHIDPKRIGLWGNSMGAATSIHAAALDHMSGHRGVKSIFVDSSFARTTEPVQLRMTRDGVPIFLQEWVVYWMRSIPSVDVGTFNPIELMKHIKAPVFIVHAKKDIVVAVEDAVALYKEFAKNHPNIPSDLWLTEASGHVKSAREMRSDYARKMVNFFRSYL